MFKLSNRCPTPLLSKWQLIGTTVFTGLFALVSALLFLSFVPFDSELFPMKSLVHSVVFAEFVLLLVLSLSRRFLAYFRGDDDFLIGHYVSWCLLEILVYSLIISFFIHITCMLSLDDAPSLLGTFWRVFPMVLYCLGLPYIICGIVFTAHEERNTLRVVDYTEVVSDAPASSYEDRKITLYDNAGSLKMSINSDSLFFFESDDNYIKVWYSAADGEIKQYMLRCRLKTIEDSFADTMLVRCHRKYIVNINKVNILKSAKEGYMMDLGLESMPPIPVSKTYEQAVLARFNSRS